MKKTQTITLIAALLLLLPSCVVKRNYYEMVEFKAKGADSANASVIENDDISVSYNMWSSGGSIHMRLYNKSDSNLLIHWQNSTLVVNNMVVNYNSNDKITVQTNSTADYYRYRNFSNSYPNSSQSLSVNQTLQLQQQPSVSMLPPGTYVDRSPYTIGQSFHDPVAGVDSKTGYKIYHYAADSSPFNIDNIISYSYLSDISRQKTMKTSLSLSRVVVMDQEHYDELRTDTKQLAYYNHKTSEEISPVGVIATAAITAAIMAAAVYADE